MTSMTFSQNCDIAQHRTYSLSSSRHQNAPMDQGEGAGGSPFALSISETNRWRCSLLLNLTVILHSPTFLSLSVFVFPMYLSLYLSFPSLPRPCRNILRMLSGYSQNVVRIQSERCQNILRMNLWWGYSPRDGAVGAPPWWGIPEMFYSQYRYLGTISPQKT